MVLKDIKVLYKQTILGFSWAIIRPIITMIIFTFVFGNLAEIPSDGIPYPIFSFSALLPWLYFSTSLSKSTQSIIGNSHIFTKVYFPRIIIPLTPIVAGLIDFIIAMIILFLLMGFYGIIPTVNILWLPFLILMMIITSAGFGFWFSALAVQYRDVKYAVQFIVQILMYAAPVVWPVSLLRDKFGEQIIYWYGLYPMAGVIEGFRSSLLSTNPMPWELIIIGFITSNIILISGFLFFSSRERIFADVV